MSKTYKDSKSSKQTRVNSRPKLKMEPYKRISKSSMRQLDD